ncbi:cell division protein ZapA [Clostridium cellulovorans]|uniref:Cell division protein ZapA n=1 Tax=Clostridium cellulovorans (strain ATCC 35296 / DSM 3052 / OCM 3 / 743B) TaxID=573061 RepID=D9SM37_CLOC7|nr:cell division protein ZapA [Clostridium cellulovorans]ADL51768.1 protein of unknown function DUF710 [Clostridium cellulovorans 743B]
MNIVTVKVNGIEYNLKGEEKEEYLHKVAGHVDKTIRSMMENNPKLSTTEASILAAMNSADELFKWGDYIEELENKTAILESTQKGLKETTESLKLQVTHLDKYNKELESKLEKYSSDNLQQDYLSLKEQFEVLKEEAKKIKEENKALIANNKELKFNLQSAKYRIIEYENKIIDSQVMITKLKKDNSKAPIIKKVKP